MTTASDSSIIDIEQQGSYCYTYSEHHPPIARVQPGQRVRVHCVDCFENRLTDEKMAISDAVQFPYTNPQTGPLFIEGASPGDTLAVTIEDIELTRDWAVTCLVPGFGLLSTTAATRMLHAPFKQRVRKLPVRDGRVWFDKFSRPVAPFLGTLGTAPKLEAINALTPWSYGGNMDCPEMCAGNTVHLPVNVEGGLFFCGDGHAAQGDGEIGGVACEIPVNVTCRFEVIKGQTIAWPRVMNEEYLMTVGCARPLEDATRIACAELVEWVAAEQGMDAEDALMWLTQVIELRVGNAVDPNYAVVAKLQRRYLEA